MHTALYDWSPLLRLLLAGMAVAALPLAGVLWRQRRAQAHATFAAGLVAQDNDAPEKAYEFFEKSVDHDPSNEPLVLDVARHLLDRKQPGRAAALLKRAAAQPGASGAVSGRAKGLSSPVS